MGNVCRKYSKRSITVGETEDQYNQLSNYSRRKRLDEETEDQCNQQSNNLKSRPKETISERAKLMPQKKKTETGIKILTSNKLLTRNTILLAQRKAENSSKELIKQSQTNSIFFVSA